MTHQLGTPSKCFRAPDDVTASENYGAFTVELQLQISYHIFFQYSVNRAFQYSVNRALPLVSGRLRFDKALSIIKS